MRCTSAGAHEQHSALWLSSRRAALRRGPRAAPTRSWMHVRRATPAALVRSAHGCKRTRDQPPCHSSSSTYRAQLGARDRPRTSIAPKIAGARKSGGGKCGLRRNTCKRLRSSNSVVVSARQELQMARASVAPELSEGSPATAQPWRCSAAKSICMRSLCSAPATPGRRRKARLGRARRAAGRPSPAGHKASTRAVMVAARVPSGEQKAVQPAAASPAAQLHSFAPPPLLPNSTRKKSLSAPSFFAAALGKILPFFVV